jgi:branched-chain amino acid aminotransferase
MIWFGNRDGGSLLGSEMNTINPADRGFTVGQGVFETLTVRTGRAFALERHLDRLVRSAYILQLPEPNLAVVREAAHSVISANLSAIGDLGRLRITYTAGMPEHLPTLILTCVAQTPWPDSTTAVTVPWTRNERSAIAGAKTTSYAENILAMAAAREAGAAEAIFANGLGNLCEGSASNIFVVLNGEVLTPSLASGCLPGVTRELVIQWFKIKEAELPMSVLEVAEEIFLTSSTRGIHPVVRLDQRSLEVGKVTSDLREQFQSLVAGDINP